MSKVCELRYKRSAMAVAAAVLLSACAASPVQPPEVRPVFKLQGGGSEDVSARLLDEGVRYYAEGKYGLALSAFDSVRRRYPGSLRALNGIGACFDRLGRYDVAQSYYYQALSIAPDDPRALNNLGYSLTLQGRYADAARVLRLSLKQDPENAYARHNLAQAEAHLSDEFAQTRQLASAPDVQTTSATVGKPVRRADIAGSPAQAVATSPAMAGGDSRESAGPVAEGGGDGHGAPSGPEPAARVAGSTSSVLLGPERVTQGVPPVTRVENVAGVVAPTGTDSAAALAASSRTPDNPEAGGSVVPAIEVANGNGRRGFARLVAEYLSGLGESVARIVNAESFTYAQTQVVYPQRSGKAAARLADRLPVAAAIKRDTAATGNGALRVVLGEDMLAYEAGIRRAMQDTDASTAVARGDATPIEVSNGNGRNGMAKSVSVWLRGQGETVARITNADSFNYKASIVYYVPGLRQDARELAARLPVEPVLTETPANASGVGLRLVIGRDLLRQDYAMRAAIAPDA